MKQHLSILRFASLCGGLALTAVTCEAQEVFKIDQLARSDGVVSIQFTDSRSAAVASTRALATTASLNPPINWTTAAGVFPSGNSKASRV